MIISSMTTTTLLSSSLPVHVSVPGCWQRYHGPLVVHVVMGVAYGAEAVERRLCDSGMPVPAPYFEAIKTNTVLITKSLPVPGIGIQSAARLSTGPNGTPVSLKHQHMDPFGTTASDDAAVSPLNLKLAG